MDILNLMEMLKKFRGLGQVGQVARPQQPDMVDFNLQPVMPNISLEQAKEIMPGLVGSVSSAPPQQQSMGAGKFSYRQPEFTTGNSTTDLIMKMIEAGRIKAPSRQPLNIKGGRQFQWTPNTAQGEDVRGSSPAVPENDALSQLAGAMSNLPGRSSTSSPGIGKDGKRTNSYWKKK